jgi:hypothetical protein
MEKKSFLWDKGHQPKNLVGDFTAFCFLRLPSYSHPIEIF